MSGGADILLAEAVALLRQAVEMRTAQKAYHADKRQPLLMAAMDREQEFDYAARAFLTALDADDLPTMTDPDDGDLRLSEPKGEEL